MNRCVLVMLTVGVFSHGVAAESDGRNLLFDGRFDAEQVAFPEFWSRSNADKVVYQRTGGPEHAGAWAGLRGEGDGTGTVSVRQYDLILVPGETYKISAYVRTKGFASRSAGLIVHNNGWFKADGVRDFPVDSEWTFMEKTFTLFPSKDNQYGVAMYAIDPAGAIDFADVKLEPLTERGQKGSSSPWLSVMGPRLVPLQPRLNQIPSDKPELTLKLFGSLPDRRDMYQCTVRLDEDDAVLQAIAEDGKMVVALSGVSRGDHTLEAVVRHRESGEVYVQARYPISVIDVPVVDRTNIRPLNNLVAELLNRSIEEAAEPQEFSFVSPRNGWVFVALATESPGTDLAVRIDGSEPVITATTDRLEAFRELPIGEHRITICGNKGTSQLRVHAIPEIFDYPPCANSHVPENGDYDWEFMKKHILYAVTTLNGGRLPGEALPEAKARGLKWLANFNVAPVDDPETVRKRMERHAGMTEPQYDGFTSDELFFGRASIAAYTKALWGLNNPHNRLVYTWIVGKPSIASVHTDFMSACINASKGRGRLLFEAYCHPQSDESAAAAYLDDHVTETMRRFNAFFPNAASGTGIIFGNFNQIPIISLEHDPGVDFKYFLDMQVNLIANHPEFAGLATTGYWGTYYGDEELVRWSFKLMRHYAVEGNKDMLSSRYGLKYNPGFLANGDFLDGMDGWDVAPAAEGAIRPATIDGYGKNVQARWGAGRAGDTVCLMTRQNDRPNRISQTAKGLEPGKTYCLQFVTADYNDVVEKKHNPRQYGIDVLLAGVEVLPEGSFVHIDRRKTHHRHDSGYLGKINLHRIVFRARNETQVVAFSDEKAEPGETLAINFVQLKAYLE